jgi:hypothetical protein
MRRPGALRRHPDFLKLWAGETVSLFGSQVTVLALPLTAILTLGASARELGVLNAARFAPFLLLTLVAGVWVDRRRRRPAPIGANAGRALLIGAVPALAYLGLLRIEYLCLIAFLAGTLTVFFDLAYQAYVPSLIGRAHVVEGNSKLQVSASAAEAGDPGLGGVLVQLLTAPAARAFGVGPVIVAAVGVECASFLLVPLAGGPVALMVSLLALAFFLAGVGLGASNVHVVSLRQIVTPDTMLGRANAAYRTLTYGAIPLGALGLLLALLWVACSPIRRLRALADVAELSIGLPEAASP